MPILLTKLAVVTHALCNVATVPTTLKTKQTTHSGFNEKNSSITVHTFPLLFLSPGSRLLSTKGKQTSLNKQTNKQQTSLNKGKTDFSQQTNKQTPPHPSCSCARSIMEKVCLNHLCCKDSPKTPLCYKHACAQTPAETIT